jgi:poly(3-hydroxybutyrate) depolymerase
MTRSAFASCARYLAAERAPALLVLLALAAGAAGAQGGQPKLGPLVDRWVQQPVDDATYRSFLSFFQYDRRLPFDVQVKASSDTGGLRRERLSFVSTSGVRVTANLVQPLSVPSGPQPAIIFLHGGTRPGKDTPRYVDFVDFFGRAGYRVLSIDMPYFGERATDLMTSFSEEEKHERLYNVPATYLGFVTQLVKDVGRSIDFLVAERRTDPSRILLLGFSRGGQMAYIVGAAESRLRGVVALYAGHMDHLELEHLPAACPANYIGRISPRPLFTMNGNYDADYSRDSTVIPLLKLAKRPVESVWLETGHSLPPDNLRAPLMAWLQARLR